MAVSKGLGKGLGALFGGTANKNTPQNNETIQKAPVQNKKASPSKVKNTEKTATKVKSSKKQSPIEQTEQTTAKEQYKYLPLVDIYPNPHQPRRQFHDESLLELAESIKNAGIIQPLIVRPQANGKYLIIAGERRYRASKLAGLTEVPAVIRELDDRNLLKEALIENIQREDLNVIDEALALKTLKEEHGFTQELLSEVTGKPRSSIANTLRVLTLAPNIQDALKEDLLSFGHAKLLMGLENAEEQLKVASQILQKSFSVRQTEEYLKKIREARTQKPEPVEEKPVDEYLALYVKDLEERLIRQLQTKVQVQMNKRGGEIKIFYYSNEELENVLDRLNVKL